MIALIYNYLTSGLDAEAIQNLNYRLEDVGGKLFNPPAPDAPKPPDWWVPEEQNWANIQSFLGTASTIEGAISKEMEVKDHA